MPSTPPSGIPVATGSLRTPRLAIAAAFGVQGLLFISLTTRLPVLADLFDFDELALSGLMLMMVLLAGVGSVGAEAIAKRRFLLVDGGRAPLNLVWVDHVCDVMLRAAFHDDARGEAFNVMDEVDRRPPSVREVGLVIAQEIGAPIPRLSLPYPVAMSVARVVAGAFAALKPDATPPLSPFVVKILTRDVIYDASKAAKLLGWAPKVGALEGLRREARAFAARRRAG